MRRPSAQADTTKSPWNSLERAKFAVSIVSPVAIVLLGCVIWFTQRDVVERWETQQQIEKRALDSRERERERLREFRLTIYKDVAPLLNDIHAYHFYVGRWKELTPINIIEKKRELDQLMYSHEMLFSPAFFELYWSFMRAAFATPGNNREESKIRSQSECRQFHWTPGSEKWPSMFTGQDNRENVCAAYRKLQERLSEELLFQSVSDADRATGRSILKCPPIYDVSKCT